MNKLSYGSYTAGQTFDYAFSAGNNYTEPTSETERRKQLSYPLDEIKTFLGNVVPVLETSDSTAVQLVVGPNTLKYRTTAGGTKNDVSLGIPTGGTTGQALVKKSNTDNDVEWSSLVPSGGTTGQVLVKKSGTDYDVEWGNPQKWLPTLDTTNVIYSFETSGTCTYEATQPCIAIVHSAGATATTLNGVSMGVASLQDLSLNLVSGDELVVYGNSTWVFSVKVFGIKWVAV